MSIVSPVASSLASSVSPAVTRVAIAGLGAVGKVLARALAVNGIPGMALVAVSANDLSQAQAFVRGLGSTAPAVPLNELEPLADLVVECAPAALLGEIVTPFLRAGKGAVVLSVGGLLKRPELVQLARERGGTIHLPTGALIGLDAMIAAAEGKITSVRMASRKPPQGYAGAPHLQRMGIRLDGLKEPLMIFAGNANEAVEGFPANVNVVAALALAGIGPEKTQIEIWADPGITRNTHSITVESDAARFSMTIENIPSENPKTSRIVGQSLIALLRKMRSPLRVGT